MTPTSRTQSRRKRQTRGDGRAAIYARIPPCDCDLVAVVPVRTMSEGNSREHHMTKYRRKEKQQVAAFGVLANLYRRRLPVVVTLTRLAPRKVDPGAEWMKHVQDEVARWLGCDDGDESAVTWVYAQEKSKVYGVRVEVKARV